MEQNFKGVAGRLHHDSIFLNFCHLVIAEPVPQLDGLGFPFPFGQGPAGTDDRSALIVPCHHNPIKRHLRPAGRMVIFGAADLMPSGTRTNWLLLTARYLTRPRIDPIQMVSANKSVMGFNLIWLWEQADRLPKAYDALERYITCPPHIGRRFPFTEAPVALRHLQSGRSIGKVVLDV